MANVGRIYDTNRAQANEAYRTQLLSRQYSRDPMLGFLMANEGGVGNLRPESLNLVGGKSLPHSKREELLGSYQVNYFWQTGTGATDQTANLTATSNVPSMTTPATNSQAFLRKSAFFKWTKKMTEVLVWNVTTELAAGQFALGDALLEAQNIGMQNHFDSLIQEIYVGDPTDQTADLWDEQPGIINAIDDNNIYGGIDRSLSANIGWRSFRDSTARSATRSLVDTYHIDIIGSYTKSVQEISDGFDLVIWNRDAYLAVKAEAEARGPVINVNDVPEYAASGIKMEAFKYHNTFHTWSPNLKDWTGIASGNPNLSAYALFTNMGEWCFRTNPKMGLHKVGPWTFEGQYVRGGADARRTLITTGYQFFILRSWSSLLAENVS